MPLTLEEQERRAYISGDVERAAVLAQAIDCRDEQIDALMVENEMLKAELSDANDEIEGRVRVKAPTLP